jgi:hypothetical protein
MFRLEFDAENKVVRLAFTGVVPAEEALRCAEQLTSSAGSLPTGFRLLTDLSALQAMDLGAAPHVQRVMDLCNQRGIQTVVRVIPDPHKDIGLNIMSLFHYGRGVRIVTCQTMAEAERILAY